MNQITQKVTEAEQISISAKHAYDKASSDAKDAATLSLELRENLRQKDVEQKFSDWHYEFQRLNKTIQSSEKHLSELSQRRKNSEGELLKIASKPEEIAQKRGQLIETKGFAETERGPS